MKLFSKNRVYTNSSNQKQALSIEHSRMPRAAVIFCLVVFSGQVHLEAQPAPFEGLSFTDVDRARPNTIYSSNTVVLQDFEGALNVTVNGGTDTHILKNDTNAGISTAVIAGDRLALQTTSPGSVNTTTEVVVTIGVENVSWLITTATIDPLVEEPGSMSGATAGDFSVDERGAAVYSIAITSSPGTGGMQLDLALTYHSQGGNGLLGMGWLLYGLSQISRCGTSLAQDGFIDGADFDDNDKYCLDGERLIATRDGSGNLLESYEARANAYGTDGTEYRMEHETFSRVISVDLDGDRQPDFFTVETKAGLKFEYGNTADSHIEVQGKSEALVWAVNKISDTLGNYVTVTYTEENNNGEYRPQRVDYTGNATTGLLPFASVRFNYEDRPDLITRYVAGSEIRISRRMKSIDTYYENQLVRSYQLSYEVSSSTGRSRIQSIEECGSDGSCFEPTIFTWKDNTEESFGITDAPSGLSRGYRSGKHRSRQYPGDFNGDGITDIVNLQNNGDNWLALSNGDGSFTDILHPQGLTRNYWGNGSITRQLLGDYNGDGLTDIVSLQYDANKNWLALSNGDGTFADLNKPKGLIYSFLNNGLSSLLSGDFNGDGLSDIVTIQGETSWLSFSNGDGTFGTVFDIEGLEYEFKQGYSRQLSGDFNGDGLSDIINIQADAMNWVAFSNGDGTFDTVRASKAWTGQITPIKGLPPLLATNYRILSGDFNGDRLTDIAILITPGNDWVSFSNGDGTFSRIVSPSGFPPEYSGNANHASQLTGDFNGDGLTDIAQLHGDVVKNWMVLSKGDGGFEFLPYIEGLDHGFEKDRNKSNRLVGDFDGDGIADIVNLDSDGSNDVWLGLNHRQTTDVLTAITDGHGKTTEMTYAPITDASVFTKGDILLAPEDPASQAYNYPESCLDVQNVINRGNGTYMIDPDGEGGNPPFEAYCNLQLDGGGWTKLTEEVSETVLNTDPSIIREYLYEYTGKWYRSPPSTLVWDWYSPQTLSGEYFISTGLYTSSFECISNEEAAYGISCGNGYSGYKALINQTTGRYPTLAQVRLCQGYPNIFGGGNFWHNRGCQDGVTVFIRPKGHVVINGPLPDNAEYPKRSFQAPIYVVSSVSNSDGLVGWRTSSYHYSDAKVDLHGRGFLGFRSIAVTNDETGIVTTTTYALDHRLRGFVECAQQHLPDGTLVHDMRNTFALEDYGGSGRFFAYVDTCETEIYDLDGQLKSSSMTSQAYDSLGNLVYTNTQHDDGSSATTVHTYVDDVTNWFLGRLVRTVVTKSAPGQADIVRTSAFSYDAQTGLLKTETVEPDHPTLASSTAYQHDVYGNIVASTISGPDIAPRTHTSSYDAKGRFATSSINTLGHTESRTYESLLGNLATVTGPNGLTTSYEYDGFGRQVRELRADGTETRTAYRLCESGNDCPPNAAYFIHTQSSGRPPTVTYADHLDRELRTETIGFDGRKIFVDKVYNARGEIEKVSEPTFAGETPLWTTTTHDIIGRPVSVTAPGNRTITIQYDGAMTIVTNPLGQQSIRTSNRHDQITSSTDNLGNLTTFRYNSAGNLIEMEDSGGNLTTIDYDLLGNKVRLDDPDTGVTTYHHDALGQLISQTDANGDIVTFDYDLLGRLIQRTEPEGSSVWTYDTQPMGIGKPAAVTGPNPYTETYAYDSFGRPRETLTVIENEAFGMATTHDQYGRIATLTYPNSFAVSYHYNQHAHLASVSRGYDDHLVWQADERNARGQLVQSSLGNSLTTERSYHAETGRIENVRTGGGSIQDLEFSFDAIGNLKLRRDLRLSLEETFTYDDLNRLTESWVSGQEDPITVSYDNLGNITYKSDVGSYTYGEYGAGPHAVTSISGIRQNTYSYDANGNRIGRSIGTTSYTSFNKPRMVAEGTTVLNFSYNPNHARYRQVIGTAEGSSARTYIAGGLFEREESENGTSESCYIRAGESTVAVFIEETDSAGNPMPTRMRYLHGDHLDSLQAVTDELGNLEEVHSFDAWGNRRGIDWAPASGPSLSAINRGFTGHEHLEAVNLIHMNGRIYDPVIARFLSADPFVQAPEHSQSLNRYSYVINNPLSLKDPSGFFFGLDILAAAFLIDHVSGGSFFEDNWQFLLEIYVNAAITIVSFYAPPVVAALVAGVGRFTLGFANTLAAGGSLEDALLAGARDGILAAAEELGNGFGTARDAIGGLDVVLPKIVAHGSSGGGFSVIDGGRLEHGFLSRAALAASGSIIGIARSVVRGDVRAALSSAIGGTATQLGGGKFANGAITGAFQELFGDTGAQSSGKSAVSSREGPDQMTGTGAGSALDKLVYPLSGKYVDKPLTASRSHATRTFLEGVSNPDEPAHHRVFDSLFFPSGLTRQMIIGFLEDNTQQQSVNSLHPISGYNMDRTHRSCNTPGCLDPANRPLLPIINY